jgi:hypothetical protein
MHPSARLYDWDLGSPYRSCLVCRESIFWYHHSSFDLMSDWGLRRLYRQEADFIEAVAVKRKSYLLWVCGDLEMIRPFADCFVR